MTVRDNPLWPQPLRSPLPFVDSRTRNNPLWPELPEAPKSTCPRADCRADTTGQVSFGHCQNCGHHIGGRTAKQWHFLVHRPCPACARPW